MSAPRPCNPAERAPALSDAPGANGTADEAPKEHGDAFNELLQQLSRQHRQELQCVQLQVQRLQDQLRQPQSTCQDLELPPMCAAWGDELPDDGARPCPRKMSDASTSPVRSLREVARHSSGEIPGIPLDEEPEEVITLQQHTPPAMTTHRSNRSSGLFERQHSARAPVTSGEGDVHKDKSLMSISGKAKFTMLEVWEDFRPGEDADERQSSALGSTEINERWRMLHSLSSLEPYFKRWEDKSLDGRQVTCQRLLIAAPTSPTRLLWDFFGAFLIFYDLIKLPLETFDPPSNDFTSAMDWFILCFWTLNVFASVTVGYVEHGVLVSSPRKILLRYLRTWFVLDLLVLVPDWIFTILDEVTNDGASGNGDIVRLLRVMRFMRTIRLLRLLKLRKVFDTLNDMIDSEYISVIANLLRMIMMLLIINHLICCQWHMVSVNADGPTWIKIHGFKDAHWAYKYTTAFHWSITQFTPASMDVQPQNQSERIFTLVVVVFALVGFSYMVGSITGSLGQLRSMHAEESMLFWDLKRYLKRNKVARGLSIRIQKYLEHAWRVQVDKKTARQVKLMDLLSEQLTAELKFELAVPQLSIHPMFERLIHKSKVTVNRLAIEAIGHKLLAADDTLFHPGEAATHMYIVVEGSFDYTRIDTLKRPHHELVDKGEDWIAEPVLWVHRWVHQGILKAIEDSDNLTIDAKQFVKQVQINPQAHEFAATYATSFLKWLNDQDFEQLSDISQGEDVGELFASFIPNDHTLDRSTSKVSTSASASFLSRVKLGQN